MRVVLWRVVRVVLECADEAGVARVDEDRPEVGRERRHEAGGRVEPSCVGLECEGAVVRAVHLDGARG